MRMYRVLLIGVVVVALRPQLRIASISFLPSAGTVAKVRVVVGESEETVWLEKRNGEWVASGR